MMKNIYESPEIEVSSYSFDDVVSTSGAYDNWYGDEDEFGG